MSRSDDPGRQAGAAGEPADQQAAAAAGDNPAVAAPCDHQVYLPGVTGVPAEAPGLQAGAQAGGGETPAPSFGTAVLRVGFVMFLLSLAVTLVAVLGWTAAAAIGLLSAAGALATAILHRIGA